MHTGERQQTSKNVAKSDAKVNRKPTKWRSGGSGETSLNPMDSPRFRSKEKCGFQHVPARKPTPTRRPIDYQNTENEHADGLERHTCEETGKNMSIV